MSTATWSAEVSRSPADPTRRERSGPATARSRLRHARDSSRPPPKRWGVPPLEVGVDSGVVSHSSGKRATFGELAAVAETMPIPDDVQPKDPSAYKLIGHKGRLRVDTPGKILGTTRFTIDVSLPDMLTAIVLHPPRFGGKVASVDDRAALAEAGCQGGRSD